MARGFKTGGRQKGTRNKRTMARAELQSRHGAEAASPALSKMRECAERMHRLADEEQKKDSQTPQATCDAVEALRRQRYTGKQIARELGISPATVSRILRRRGLNKLSALEPAEPVRRYEREKAGV